MKSIHNLLLNDILYFVVLMLVLTVIALVAFFTTKIGLAYFSYHLTKPMVALAPFAAIIFAEIGFCFLTFFTSEVSQPHVG